MIVGIRIALSEGSELGAMGSSVAGRVIVVRVPVSQAAYHLFEG